MRSSACAARPGQARRPSCSATRTARPCPPRSARRRPRWSASFSARTPASGWGSTATTTPNAAWRTRSPPSRRGPPPGGAAGVEAGARQVQGTMNGIGERTGNANLVSIIAGLQLKLGHRVVSDEQLASLTLAAHFVDELLNSAPDPSRPYVGRNAFAHKGGMHVAGVRADATTFEHVPPESVGNTREIVMSELAGRSAAAEKAREAGLELDDDAAARVTERVKALEHAGYQFEAADGSFELLVRRENGTFAPLFTVESWRVIVEQRRDGAVETEATIKIWVDGERYVRTAEGNGPVHALDAALRAAITEIHPHLADIELVNYKVRILDESHGTGAVTRVLIDASDGTEVWGSIGVNENVIAASWEALVDSLAYAEQPGRRRGAARAARSA